MPGFAPQDAKRIWITDFYDVVHYMVFQTQSGHCIYFHPQVKGWEASTLLSTSERANLISGSITSHPFT
jgi:hypothetical protein